MSTADRVDACMMIVTITLPMTDDQQVTITGYCEKEALGLEQLVPVFIYSMYCIFRLIIDKRQ